MSQKGTRTRADGIESDGVMRLDECQQVQKDLSDALGINLTVVDAAQRFLEGLKGVEDPEVAPPPLPAYAGFFFPLTSPQKKRKFIGMSGRVWTPLCAEPLSPSLRTELERTQN